MYSAPTPAEKAKKPPAYHRLVQKAPNGEKTLYLAAHAKQIIGKDLEESQKILWDLVDWCTQPQYVFSMEWLHGGDMVWWDSECGEQRENKLTCQIDRACTAPICTRLRCARATSEDRRSLMTVR